MSGIAIKLVNGEVPPKCMQILLDLAAHRDECLDCTIAYTNKLGYEKWCSDGQRFLTELSQQDEVKPFG